MHLLHAPRYGWLLTPMCLFAAGAGARPGLTAAEIADKARPAVVSVSADTAAVRAVDDRTDLAILQLAGFGLPSVALGDSDSLRPGDRVVLLGNPRGREGGASTGMVRRLRTTETGLKVIETDARADWGSSGGPLLALDGRVVGVLSFKLKGARRSKFAVPINHARRLISSARASPK